MNTLPVPVMPFPPAGRNPALGKSRAPVWQWIDQSKIAVEDDIRALLRRADPELTCARYFPGASLDFLIYLGQLMAWIFVNDDEFDDSPLGRRPGDVQTAIERRCAILRGAPGRTYGVMEQALADLCLRLPAERSVGWRHSFHVNMEAFLRTYATEASARNDSRTPSLSEYLEHRRDTAGTRWCADLVEVAVGVDLPEKVRSLEAYQALKDAAAEHCGLLNDMHSIGKERATGQIHNAVAIVQHGRQCDLNEALDYVNDLLTAAMRRLELAARDLSGRPDVGQWVTGVLAMVRGNYDWHYESERYRNDWEACDPL